MVSLLNLKLAVWLDFLLLSELQDLCLSFPQLQWGYRCLSLHLTFCRHVSDLNSGPHAGQQAVYPRDCLPAPALLLPALLHCICNLVCSISAFSTAPLNAFAYSIHTILCLDSSLLSPTSSSSTIAYSPKPDQRQETYHNRP